MTIVVVLCLSSSSPSSPLETIATVRCPAPAIFSVIAATSFSSVFVSVWSPVPLLGRGRAAETTTSASSASTTSTPTSLFQFWAKSNSLVPHTPLFEKLGEPGTHATILRLPLFPGLFICIPSKYNFHDAILQTLVP